MGPANEENSPIWNIPKAYYSPPCQLRSTKRNRWIALAGVVCWERFVETKKRNNKAAICSYAFQFPLLFTMGSRLHFDWNWMNLWIMEYVVFYINLWIEPQAKRRCTERQPTIMRMKNASRLRHTHTHARTQTHAQQRKWQQENRNRNWLVFCA